MQKLIEIQDDQCLVFNLQGTLLAAFAAKYQPIYAEDSHSLFAFEFLPEMHFNAGEGYDSTNFFRQADDACFQAIIEQQWLQAVELVDRLNTRVSFNIDMAFIADSNFVAKIASHCRDRLVLEVNGYDLFAEQMNHFIKNIRLLRAKGVEVWLNDYDARKDLHNRYLKLKIWDGVKLDADFSHHLARKVVKINFLNKLKGYAEKIVLCGVNQPELKTFSEINSVYAQGNYCSYPLSTQQVNDFYRCA